MHAIAVKEKYKQLPPLGSYVQYFTENYILMGEQIQNIVGYITNMSNTSICN